MPQPTSKHIDRLWAESFAKALVQPKLPPGDGWLMIDQIVKKFRVNDFKARCILRDMVKEGKIERFKGQQIVNGRVYRAIYYRPKGLKNAI